MLRGVERPATVRSGDLGDLTVRWEDQDIAATFREALAEHLDAQVRPPTVRSPLRSATVIVLPARRCLVSLSSSISSTRTMHVS